MEKLHWVSITFCSCWGAAYAAIGLGRRSTIRMWFSPNASLVHWNLPFGGGLPPCADGLPVTRIIRVQSRLHFLHHHYRAAFLLYWWLELLNFGHLGLKHETIWLISSLAILESLPSTEMNGARAASCTLSWTSYFCAEKCTTFYDQMRRVVKTESRISRIPHKCRARHMNLRFHR